MPINGDVKTQKHGEGYIYSTTFLANKHIQTSD